MSWNKWIRLTHRRVAVVFMLAVAVNIVAVSQNKYADWIGLLAVAPLALLLPTGLYLFLLPYFKTLRAGEDYD